MNRKITVHTAQSSNEMVLECTDGLFGSIASMNMWWDKLIIDVLLCHEVLEELGAFIIEALQHGLETGGA